jgi:hypothetical protein
MTDATTQARANVALTVQMLAWIAERPRTYGETMDAWRTHCPRMSIWEDAISERLVAVSASPGGGMNGAAVALTPLGQGRLGGGA